MRVGVGSWGIHYVRESPCKDSSTRMCVGVFRRLKQCFLWSWFTTVVEEQDRDQRKAKCFRCFAATEALGEQISSLPLHSCIFFKCTFFWWSVREWERSAQHPSLITCTKNKTRCFPLKGSLTRSNYRWVISSFHWSGDHKGTYFWHYLLT